MKKQKLVVLSGAGISQESGIATYRDKDGLWEKYDPMALATPEAWMRDPALVLEFYNVRREKVLQAQPNTGHLKLAKLEQTFDVHIITQNVDDLHERAGSTKVLHLHGEIRKARSTKNPSLIYDISGADLNLGDYCELGSQLRPHIVWFGEAVPNIEPAVEIIGRADVFLVIGTSLNVYPAAGLIDYAPQNCRKFLIDPGEFSAHQFTDVHVIQEKAGAGMQQFCDMIL
jgi:NAD-dependent deacetylase